MSAARRILGGSFYMITRRTMQQMYLLPPDDETTQIYEFCLALAVKEYKIDPLAWLVMSNHHHLVIYDEHGNAPAFMQYFHRLIASACNARWGRREAFWSSDKPCLTVLLTEADVLDKIAYVLGNPVKAKLVDCIADWKGSSSLAYMDGKPKTIERPGHYFSPESKVIPETIELRIRAPRHRTYAAWATRVEEKVADYDARAEAKRTTDKTFRSIGMKKAAETLPTQRPAKEARKSRIRPHVACRDPKMRMAWLKDTKAYRIQREAALEELAEGKLAQVIFPEGTYLRPKGRGVVIGERDPAPPERLKHLTRIPHDDIASTELPRASL